MNRGRGRNAGGYPHNHRGRSSRYGAGASYSHRHSPVGAVDSSYSLPSGNTNGSSYWQRRTPGRMSEGSSTQSISSEMEDLKLVGISTVAGLKSSKEQDSLSDSDPGLKNELSSLSAKSDFKHSGTITCRTEREKPLEMGSSSPSQLDCPPVVDTHSLQNNPSLLAESIIQAGPSMKEVQHSKINDERRQRTSGLDNADDTPFGVPFDICPVKTGNVVSLKAPLHVKNRMKRNEDKRSTEGQNIRYLRPGMLLLKGCLTFSDQVRIVKLCRNLGLGSGGFYQPGYRDGAKLHLKMMCLGKNWDPETSTYGEERCDGARPPPIPGELNQLVKDAIQHCYTFLKEHYKVHNVAQELPSMSPNICIVNFYTQSGRLGLHQDKDESPESIRGGLPVVSFSIGDSAEFLYSDHRDSDQPGKVILESGDVLIFGGKSRKIFHGVSSILSDTASKTLLEETDLRRGRLNLTFREF